MECCVCGENIPTGTKPNLDYFMLGFDYYCLDCYREEIGYDKR